MRVSQPGRDVEADGPPYLFDGSLDTLQVHQTGVIADIFEWGNLNTAFVHRKTGVGGGFGVTVSFPELPYIPHIEWAVTSDSYGGYVEYPATGINTVLGSYSSIITSLPVAMVPTVNSFTIYATTAFSAQDYGIQHGGVARQGDLYYTVFKRPTT